MNRRAASRKATGQSLDGFKQPGFQLKPRMAHITFEGTDYDGLEIFARLDVPMGVYFQIQDLLGNRAQDPESMRELCHLFGDLILDRWNLQDVDGNPVPATGRGMESLYLATTIQVIAHWAEAVAEVPAPLGETSDAGGTSEVGMTSLADASRSL